MSDHRERLAALRDEVDQQRTRAEAAEAELREMRADREAALRFLPVVGSDSLAVAAEAMRDAQRDLDDQLRKMRADRDAALLILPAGCGSLADAADTLRQERDNLEAIAAAQRDTITANESSIESLRRMVSDFAKIVDSVIGGAK